MVTNNFFMLLAWHQLCQTVSQFTGLETPSGNKTLLTFSRVSVPLDLCASLAIDHITTSKSSLLQTVSEYE